MWLVMRNAYGFATKGQLQTGHSVYIGAYGVAFYTLGNISSTIRIFSKIKEH